MSSLDAILDERVREIVAELIGRELPNRFLSKNALAARLGIEPRTVKTWRSKGCPGVKVGREVMYSIHEVERWIESHG